MRFNDNKLQTLPLQHAQCIVCYISLDLGEGACYPNIGLGAEIAAPVHMVSPL